jgi:hypothetical protein
MAPAAQRQRQVAMHRTKLREIIHDAEIVCAIRPIVQRHRLPLEATTQLLTQLSVPRARQLAELVDKSFR